MAAVFPEVAALLDAPPLGVGGDETVMATSFAPGGGYTVTGAPVARYVFDLSDWNPSAWLVPLGASGHPGSPARVGSGPGLGRSPPPADALRLGKDPGPGGGISAVAPSRAGLSAALDHRAGRVVAGLATITPAARYVSPATACLIRVASGVVCYCAVALKNRLERDDALDVWGVHGSAGTSESLCLASLPSPARKRSSRSSRG